MSDRIKAEAEQAQAWLCDTLPPMWKRMYDRLISEGFSEKQSLTLLKTYVHASAGGSINA